MAGSTAVKLKKWLLAKVDQVGQRGSQYHGISSSSSTRKKQVSVRPTRKTRKELIEEEVAARRQTLDELEDVDDEYIKIHDLKLVFCSLTSSTEANVLECFELITLQSQLRMSYKKQHIIRRRYESNEEEEVRGADGTNEGAETSENSEKSESSSSELGDDSGDDDSYEKRLKNGNEGVISPPMQFTEVALSDVLAAVANAHRMFDVIQHNLDDIMHVKHWTIEALFESCDGQSSYITT